ncbi:MAG TPA: glycine cleavage T C-terminal barrel domain-containing protein [Thermoleophilaceae bacterium]|nr:glycine cleavage T C-terminal barrel domain-containing protein [Thermoleophilaceae bacterium]
MIATTEYELVTDSVGQVDRSDRAKFLVRGSEAADFLQGQVSNDVEALAPGTGCYATLLTTKGKLRTDLRILRKDDSFWLDTEAIGHAVLRHMLETYSLGRDVSFEDVTGSRALVSLIGPAAREALDAQPPELEHAFVEGEHGLYVSTHLGVDVIGDPGLELGVEAVSEETAECIRIESGRPRLGFDMDAETMPQEAGINERAVSFTKGCYVGQETVARLHYKGKPNRHLRGLRLSEPVERGTEILLGEKVVGRVASTCVSPRFGPIALTVLRREAEPGDEVSVNGATAEVVGLPFTRG